MNHRDAVELPTLSLRLCAAVNVKPALVDAPGWFELKQIRAARKLLTVRFAHSPHKSLQIGPSAPRLRDETVKPFPISRAIRFQVSIQALGESLALFGRNRGTPFCILCERRHRRKRDDEEKCSGPFRGCADKHLHQSEGLNHLALLVRPALEKLWRLADWFEGLDECVYFFRGGAMSEIQTAF